MIHIITRNNNNYSTLNYKKKKTTQNWVRSMVLYEPSGNNTNHVRFERGIPTVRGVLLQVREGWTTSLWKKYEYEEEEEEVDEGQKDPSQLAGRGGDLGRNNELWKIGRSFCGDVLAALACLSVVLSETI